MIKTVIFDFDGTIADTLPAIIRLFNKYAEEYSLPKLNKEEVENLRNKPALELIKFFGISSIKLPGIIKKIRSEILNSTQLLKPFPKIKEIILALKKREFQLGILTTNSKEVAEKFLQENNLQSFDFIHSELNIFGKADSLKHLFNQYQLRKDQSLYIGDEVRDIDACKEFGIKIIAVGWGFNLPEILKKNKPDFFVNEPEEILKIVDKN